MMAVRYMIGKFL